MKEIIIATDWWIFGATLGAGLLSALATWRAVVYTNKKTVEKYEKDKLIQEKEKAMVIIKPSIRTCSISRIMDDLTVFNNRERIMLLSSEKDGFDFYDDENQLHSFIHSLFLIKNENKNNIHNIKIKTTTKLTTDSNAIIDDYTENSVKLLREKEEIIFRMYNTEQRYKLWEELDKGKQVEHSFDCTIEYFTNAGDKVQYSYIAKIVSTPIGKEFDGKIETTNDRKTSILKDEYVVITEPTSDDNIVASTFRNLQDKLPEDRVTYAQRKVGKAQAEGMVDEIIKLSNLYSIINANEPVFNKEDDTNISTEQEAQQSQNIK